MASIVTVTLTLPDGRTKRVRLSEVESRAMFSPYHDHQRTLRALAEKHGAIRAKALYKSNNLGEWTHSEYH
jgi:hypothetical protein